MRDLIIYFFSLCGGKYDNFSFLLFAKFISNFIKFYPLIKMIRNIAIYGGSFDPPHKSHIALVKYLKKLPNID